jgi:c-di-GMP phosphodiesterase
VSILVQNEGRHFKPSDTGPSIQPPPARRGDQTVDTSTPVVEAFFARQPIFDRRGKALAYELLYRPTPEALAAVGDSEKMAAQVTVDAMLGTNIDAVTDGLLAFINAPREILVGGALESLDPSRVVIEILETVIPDADVIRACERLVKRGHTLALDDWFENDPRQPLVRLSRIIKVDVLERSIPDASALISQFRGHDFRLLAERVETAQVHDACVKSGFEWFQGYFYRKPEIVRQPDLRPEQILIVKAMNLVQDDTIPDHQIGAFFKKDPALAFKLLRMANAAPMGVRSIESIEHAVSIVGRSAIFRWLGLLLIASVGRNGVKRELLHEALVRARQCELLAEPAGIRPSGHLFLVGLFSRIEALLGVPLVTIVNKVVLPKPVGAALTTHDGPYAALLSVTEAYEDSKWEQIPSLAHNANLPVGQIPTAYREALDWALEVTRTL